MAHKILGMAEEGHCDHCGTMCPRRRVAVQAVYADNSTGKVEFWGVICAGQVRYGSRSTSNGNRVRAEAENADRIAAANAAELERRFVARTAGPAPEGSNPKAAANIRYHRTGRPIVGSYFLANAAGNIVRVDGTDAADVALYTSRGYTTAVSVPVQPESIPA
jgi:hypothetical protein